MREVSSLNEHLFGLDSRLGLRHCQSGLHSLPSHFPIDSFTRFSDGDALRTDVRLTNHPGYPAPFQPAEPGPLLHPCISPDPDNETH